MFPLEKQVYLTLLSPSRYSALLAAMCMVLYGFDASVFNAVQASDNWLAYFDLDPVWHLVLTAHPMRRPY